MPEAINWGAFGIRPRQISVGGSDRASTYADLRLATTTASISTAPKHSPSNEEPKTGYESPPAYDTKELLGTVFANEYERRQVLKFGALLGGGLAVAGSGLLSACGSDSAGSNAKKYSFGPPQGGTPTKGGTLRVGMISGGNGETLDVRNPVPPPDLARIFSLYDPLWFVGENGTAVPALAQKWESNAAADLWTIELRQDVTWHNGKPFTSADVLYTIRSSWLAPENGFSNVLSKIIDADNCKTDGDNVIVIALNQGLAQFPTIMGVQNCYIVQDGYTDWNNPIGTGPYVFKSFTPGQRSEFTAFDGYWKGRPGVDTLIIDSSYTSDTTRFNALLGGQLDVVPSVPPALARANASSTKIYLGNQPGPGWSGPVFRIDKDPFTDLKVRQALKLGMDRDAATDVVFNGYAVPGNDICGYTDEYFATDLKSEYDPEKAKALLKSAGYDTLNLQLQTAEIAASTNPLATLFQQQMSKIGVKVSLNQTDPSNYFTKSGGYQTRPFSMELWTNGVSSLTLFYLFDLVEGAPYQVSYWGNEEHDKLAYAAMAETDKSKAAELWHDAQVLQQREGGTLNYANYNWIDGYSTSVRGVKTTNAGPCANFDFSTAWLKS